MKIKFLHLDSVSKFAINTQNQTISFNNQQVNVAPTASFGSFYSKELSTPGFELTTFGL